MNEIITAITSLKTAIDIVKNLISISKDAAVKEKASELLTTIISLQSDMLLMQSQQSELLQSKSNLEKELEQFKKWEFEKSQHSLKQIALGVWVYILNSSKDSKQPEYWLCQNCFDNKHQKSIMQKVYPDSNKFICNNCNSSFKLPEENRETPTLTFRL